MTTGSGKKTPKSPKAGKAPASRSRRKKIVDKAPAAIDKEKMAAFFSAAGIDSKEGEPKKSGAALAAEVSVATAAASTPPAEVVVEVAEPSPVDDVSEVAPEKGSKDPGETLMKIPSEASGNGSGSGSSNMLSMYSVLLLLAFFWFYFISSSPLHKAAQVKVKQGEVAISALASKVQGLKIENRNLKNRLQRLEQVAHKWKKAARKGNTPVTVGILPAKKRVIETAPKAQPAISIKPVTKPVVKPAAKKDPSFDKAPIPFWRNMKPRGSLIKSTPVKVKPVVKVPAAKVDSFSRAPKPFWLTPRVKPAAVKAKKQVIITAPPAVKCPCTYKSATTKKEPATTPALDPSFEKAPKPFWLK